MVEDPPHCTKPDVTSRYRPLKRSGEEMRAITEGVAGEDKPFVEVVSDFTDYYDPLLDTGYLRRNPEESSCTLFRLTTDGPERPEMLDKLEEYGLDVPRRGTARALYERVLGCERHGSAVAAYLHMVVHTDVAAHRGEGKEVLSYREALARCPDAYAVEYVQPNPEMRGISYRALQVGDRGFWIRYESASDWRSNVGEVACAVERGHELELGEATGMAARLPLFAIDFVPSPPVTLPNGDSEKPRMYAIDLNVAPGVAGTGVEEYLSAGEAAAAIKRWFARFGDVEEETNER